MYLHINSNAYAEYHSVMGTDFKVSARRVLCLSGAFCCGKL